MRLRALVLVVMTVTLAACTSSQTVAPTTATTVATTKPLPAVDLSATPAGWVPVTFGDAQVSVPASFTVFYPGWNACEVASTRNGVAFWNLPFAGLTHCHRPPGLNSGNTTVLMAPPETNASQASGDTIRQRVNGLWVYTAGARVHGGWEVYLVPEFGRLTVAAYGSLARRILGTITWSPRPVVLASGPAPTVPSSWQWVLFAGLRFSVPAGWRTYRTPMWSGLELCGIRPVVPVADSITLSTDVWHGMGVCPTDEGQPRGAQQPSNGVLLDSGLSPLLVAGPFAKRCLDLHGLKVCPATSPAYSILVLSVTVPGHRQPVFVSIGLAGNGMVARTILYSLRAA